MSESNQEGQPRADQQMLAGLPAVTFAGVAMDVPLDRLFTYSVPASLDARAVRGTRALVPWRSGVRSGVIMSRSDTPPAGLKLSSIRPIADVLDEKPIIPEPQLRLLEWIAKYYHAPIGEAVRLGVPSALDGAMKRIIVATAASPNALDPGATSNDTLTDRQFELLRVVLAAGSSGVDAQKLVATVPGARHFEVSELEAAGLLASRYDAKGSKVSVLTETLVSLTGKAPEKALGAKQQSVFDFVTGNGETEYSELRELFKADRSTLRGLEKRALISTRDVERVRDPFRSQPARHRGKDPVLTDDQKVALDVIMDPKSLTVLLHGITGSGKTEVYLRAIRRARGEGKRALVLLPEIALTPQFVNVFRNALGDDIAVQHSGLSPGERFDQWRLIRRGEVGVIIGARSALFAPIDNLGVIVVDEEHDGSFKQDSSVRYNARDAATVLGRFTNATVVLGSATPSLESLSNARAGRFALAEMPNRVAGRSLPDVELIDMRQHPPDPAFPASRWLSSPLQGAVRTTVQAGEQAIIFLNRRGYAPHISCDTCGSSLQCTDCDVSLTYHRRGDLARCHYCGQSQRRPADCPTCGAALVDEGIGTEQVEATIAEAFGDLRVSRLDRDTSRGAGLLRTIGAFRRHEIDVLVGTQMVTKGHDFPNVTLVGVIAADQSLKMPDFRSSERTMQLLTQVSGRAGRGDAPGHVMLQTYQPEHFALEAAITADYIAFADRELKFRQRLGYPPYGYMALIRIDHVDYGRLHTAGLQIARYIEKHGPDDVQLIGPVDAPIARVKTRYRAHILLRCRERAMLHRGLGIARFLHTQAMREWKRIDLRFNIDVDPINLL